MDARAVGPRSTRRPGETQRGDRLTLGLFGQLKAKKGGVFLLDALLRSGVADRFHLLLAGWMAPDMEAWLAEHELEHTALPFLDRYELLPWYAACDFIAIPSFYDGLPNVLVEAAALGVPLIASRVDGMADVLTDGETAFLFDPGDEPRAAWALQRAARLEPAERERMASACREWPQLDSAARTERSTATSRCEIAAGYVPRRSREAIAAHWHRLTRGAVILYYALGGGLGHLTRARKVLGETEAVLLTASGHARDPRVTGGRPVIPVPRRLGHDRAAFRAWLRMLLDDLQPDELLVDAFPGGILGELCGIDASARAADRPRAALGHLRAPPRRPAPRYDVVHALEPLGYDPPGPVESLALPTPRRASRCSTSRTRLVVHAGPEAELQQLLAHARGKTVVIHPRHRGRVSRRAALRPRRAHRHRRGVQRDPRDRPVSRPPHGGAVPA